MSNEVFLLISYLEKHISITEFKLINFNSELLNCKISWVCERVIKFDFLILVF